MIEKGNDMEAKAEAGTIPSGKMGEVRLKKTMVATDFSGCSRKAFEYGVSLAGLLGAEIVVLHVLEPLPPPAEVLDMASETPYREDFAQQLKEWQERCPTGIRSSSVLRDGKSVHKEIVEAARELEVDLIIVGNAGRNAMARGFLGATAEKVVRHAPCPVLVIRAKEHDFVAAAE